MARDRKRIEERLGVTLGNMTPDAPPISGRLENFSGVVHAVERGRCYFMLATLAPDAEPGKAMTHFSWRTKTESEGSVGGAECLPGADVRGPGVDRPCDVVAVVGDAPPATVVAADVDGGGAHRASWGGGRLLGGAHGVGPFVGRFMGLELLVAAAPSGPGAGVARGGVSGTDPAL